MSLFFFNKTMCVLVAVLVLALVIRPEVVGQRVGKTTAWMIAVAIWILLALASLTILLLLVGNEKVNLLVKNF